jgi:hypothetical protein
MCIGSGQTAEIPAVADTDAGHEERHGMTLCAGLLAALLGEGQVRARKDREGNRRNGISDPIHLRLLLAKE